MRSFDRLEDPVGDESSAAAGSVAVLAWIRAASAVAARAKAQVAFRNRVGRIAGRRADAVSLLVTVAETKSLDSRGARDAWAELLRMGANLPAAIPDRRVLSALRARIGAADWERERVGLAALGDSLDAVAAQAAEVGEEALGEAARRFEPDPDWNPEMVVVAAIRHKFIKGTMVRRELRVVERLLAQSTQDLAVGVPLALEAWLKREPARLEAALTIQRHLGGPGGIGSHGVSQHPYAARIDPVLRGELLLLAANPLPTPGGVFEQALHVAKSINAREKFARVVSVAASLVYLTGRSDLRSARLAAYQLLVARPEYFHGPAILNGGAVGLGKR